MLQLFRPFQWASFVVLLGGSLLLRGVPLALGLGVGPGGGTGGGAWGDALAVWLAAHPLLAYAAGALVVCLVGFAGAVTLQAYRLSAAGSVPALVGIVLGSALLAWTGFAPELLGALALAGAGHQLFGAYRHQGAALPVYNAGLWLGAGWLCASGFAWFGLWGLLALVQLRKVRAADVLGYLIGLATLPLIVGIYRYVTGDSSGYGATLTRDLLRGPTLAQLRLQLVPLLVLGVASALAVVAYGSLTNRRPVPEQRANRMWYSMLAAGWLAMVVGGRAGAWPVAYVLAPLSVLLGVWLVERPRKLADGLTLGSILLVVAGYAYLATLG